MKNELKIALIQSDLVWENPKQNRINFTKKIEAISEAVDLIVLPEMFTSGFTMNARADWVQCDVYELSNPQIAALVHPNDAQ